MTVKTFNELRAFHDIRRRATAISKDLQTRSNQISSAKMSKAKRERISSLCTSVTSVLDNFERALENLNVESNSPVAGYSVYCRNNQIKDRSNKSALNRIMDFAVGVAENQAFTKATLCAWLAGSGCMYNTSHVSRTINSACRMNLLRRVRHGVYQASANMQRLRRDRVTVDVYSNSNVDLSSVIALIDDE